MGVVVGVAVMGVVMQGILTGWLGHCCGWIGCQLFLAFAMVCGDLEQ